MKSLEKKREERDVVKESLIIMPVKTVAKVKSIFSTAARPKKRIEPFH
jgi:hypothetical protein